jgi:signal transduction histidine kinase
LALCRNVIVNKHGGTLCFESIQGVGTTFVIRLPLAIKAQPQLEAA